MPASEHKLLLDVTREIKKVEEDLANLGSTVGTLQQELTNLRRSQVHLEQSKGLLETLRQTERLTARRGGAAA